jgi:hypothetical protein
MPNQHKKKTKKSRRKRVNLQGGDIPARPRCTYTTESCLLPVVTETCIVRAMANAVATQQASGVATNPTFAFQLNLCNVGVGFWDQYKIKAIRFSIRPQNNAVQLVTNSTTTVVPLYCVIDYDDATALASVAAAEAYSTCISLSAGESCERLFQPRMAVAAYSGAFASFANMADQWIDANSTNVQHYGVKLYIPGGAAGQTQLQSWDVFIEYFIQFRKSI